MPLSRPVLLRAAVCVLAAAALASAGITLVNLLPQLRAADAAGMRGSVVAVVLLTLCSGPAAAVLSLALAWRSWHRDDARALATFLAFAAFALAGDGVWWLMRLSRAPEWLRDAAGLSVPVCVLAGMAAMLRFSCTFPRPLAADELRPASAAPSRAALWLAAAQRWSTDAAAVRRAAAWTIGLLILLPEGARIAAKAGGLAFLELDILKYAVLGLLLASMGVSALNLRAGHRRADEEGRRRIFWVLEGFLLATGIAALASALKLMQDVVGYAPPVRFWYPLAMMAAFAALLACLAVAMFYAGAVDPELAVRRTAVAGLVGLMMVVMFATVEQLLQGWLGHRLGLGDRAGGILTGVTVGLAFEPLRARTAALVERLLTPGSAVSAPVEAVAAVPRVEPA
jgi:hypothetical protein